MKKILIAMLAAGLTTGSYAYDMDSSNFGTQNTFNDFAVEAAKLGTFNRYSYANSMGITGFDISVYGQFITLDGQKLQASSAGTLEAQVLVPMVGVQVSKGLPFGIDLGVGYKQDPTGVVTVTSAEVRKEIVEGGLTMPAVSAGVNYSMLSGGDVIEGNNIGLDLAVSKGFTIFTPYAGVTYNMATMKDKSNTFDNYEGSSVNFYAGINMNLFIDLNAQYENINGSDSFTLKTGFRF